jgi:hypothetical protein
VAAEQRNLVIDAGATFRLVIEYVTQSGAAIDLTGYTAEWQARETVDGDPIIDEAPTILANTITLLLTATETAALSPGRLIYAVDIVAAGGEPTNRLIRGVIDVTDDLIR